MKNNNYLKSLGARIFSEANDLKRTIDAMANDLSVDVNELKEIIKGNCSKNQILNIIKKMDKVYPIDSSDLILIDDDSTHGTVYYSSKKSKKSSRIFNRTNKENKKTPFYEYRDTAMSKLAPFKPEWIKELRIVDNNDPYNPDVSYNNGHFMHQMTFFVGAVNFYYELNGKKYCEEMNTGDSNYITPYIPHTFTSRDASKEAYIVAITFGGDVRRSQKELYALGVKRTLQYKLDIRDENKAISQLILQNMKNENLTKSILKKEKKIDIDQLLDTKKRKSKKDLKNIAQILNIEISDLLVPKYKKEHEVVICKKVNSKQITYPSAKNKQYKIHNLARANKLPNVKGFGIKVLKDKIKSKDMFETSLHSYIYNYTDIDAKIIWIYNNKKYTKILKNGDSIYIQPFIKYGFINITNKKAKLCIARVGGAINICSQKELSYFTDISRVASETKCWF